MALRGASKETGTFGPNVTKTFEQQPSQRAPLQHPQDTTDPDVARTSTTTSTSSWRLRRHPRHEGNTPSTLDAVVPAGPAAPPAEPGTPPSLATPSTPETTPELLQTSTTCATSSPRERAADADKTPLGAPAPEAMVRPPSGAGDARRCDVRGISATSHSSDGSSMRGYAMPNPSYGQISTTWLIPTYSNLIQLLFAARPLHAY